MKGYLRNSRGSVVLLALLIVVVVAFFVFDYWHGVLFMPMPHDESLYRILARSIDRTGWPVRPDGQLFNINPPLAIYLHSWVMHFSGDNLRVMRYFHFALYVLPIILITMLLSRKLFGSVAAWVAFIVYAGLAFFLTEAIPVELDIPFTLYATALLYLLMSRRSVRQTYGGTLWLDLLIGLVLAIASLTKFYQTLIFIPIIACILLSEVFAFRWETVESFVCIFLVTLLGPLLWFLWNWQYGADVGTTLMTLGRAVFLGDPVYLDDMSKRNVASYALFVVCYVSIPLFAAIALSVTLHNRRLEVFFIPLLFIFWTLVAMGISKVRVVRYFDPAIPAAVLLASGLCSDRVLEICGHMRRFMGWFLGLGVLLCLLLLKVFSDRHYSVIGFQVEFYKVIFFVAFFGFLILALLPWIRRSQISAAIILLIGSIYLFSLNEMPLFAFTVKNWQQDMIDRRLASELKERIPAKATVATTSMTVAYYIDHNYYHFSCWMKERILDELGKHRPEYLFITDSELKSCLEGEALQKFVAANYQVAEAFKSEGRALYKLK